MRLYSVIIPVYNRPDEVDELLDSLTRQSYTNFEVLIIEDGSTERCESAVEKYRNKLDIAYYFKENSGQGFSRNYGYERAKGDYFIVFDSDCLIPEHYFEAVEKQLNADYLDAFGGPDKADTSFTITQKAINQSMTSIFTTGGIRGRKQHAGTYHPRSFNMGISRQVFDQTGGYNLAKKGEDIDFSIRIIEAGFKVGLIEDAFVYHKRRTSLSQFFKQLHFFGRARINVNRIHPGELKLVHLFPLVFTIGIPLVAVLIPVLPTLGRLGLAVYLLYFLMIFLEGTIRNRSIVVGVMGVFASIVQLTAYAIGMVEEAFSKSR
jgi:glycosyltransferase involved in cell wall biosynthesis